MRIAAMHRAFRGGDDARIGLDVRIAARQSDDLSTRRARVAHAFGHFDGRRRLQPDNTLGQRSGHDTRFREVVLPRRCGVAVVMFNRSLESYSATMPSRSEARDDEGIQMTPLSRRRLLSSALAAAAG